VSRSPEPPADDQTRIIRRAQTPAQPQPDDTRTGIIRRAPTGPIPISDARLAPATEHIAAATTQISAATTQIRQLGSTASPAAGPATAVATCVLAMLSGWATTVLATSLIAGWWHTDLLFCAAVAFLTVVFAVATASGVVLLMLRRPVGRYLIVAGAVVALLAFGGVFIAGARVPWAVFVLPVLPVASAVLAMLPSTRRWCVP
jgi:hypothetical protein